MTLTRIYRRAIVPETKLSVSEWADRHRYVASGTSALPGKWRTEVTPYLREPMDLLSPSSPYEKIIIMKAAQTGFSEMAFNFLAFTVAHNPGLLLYVMPSLEDAKRNVKSRVDPMIASTPELSRRIAPARARDSGNTMFAKEFPGGQLLFSGSNSPSALRSMPIKFLVLDELDGYEIGLKGEGSPESLALARTATYEGRGRKVLMISTPTLKGLSRIERAYLSGDQRRFFCPCPHCGEMQTLEGEGLKYTTPNGEHVEVYYECSHHGCVIEERHKAQMIAAGEWRATATASDPKTASFHLSALYSPMQSWQSIIYDSATGYLASKDKPERHQVWTNTKLGESYEDTATAPIPAEVIASRCEHWDPDVLPEGVCLIAAGADLQSNRCEVEITGWGRNWESWSLGYEIIFGDPARPDLWLELEKISQRRFRHPKNVPNLPISAFCIDAGFMTNEVLRFCGPRYNRNVWAVKGDPGRGKRPMPRLRPMLKQGRAAPTFLVGVDSIKETVMRNLRVEEPGAGYCHFPEGRDLDYFKGLVSEKLVTTYAHGVPRQRWIKDPGARNEPLDCRAYAIAGMIGLASFCRIRIDDRAAVIEKAPVRVSAKPYQPGTRPTASDPPRQSAAAKLAMLNRL